MGKKRDAAMRRVFILRSRRWIRSWVRQWYRTYGKPAIRLEEMQSCKKR